MAGCGVWAYGLRRGEFRCGRNGSGIGGGSVRSGAVVAGVRAGGLLRENAELGFCAGGGTGAGLSAAVPAGAAGGGAERNRERVRGGEGSGQSNGGKRYLGVRVAVGRVQVWPERVGDWRRLRPERGGGGGRPRWWVASRKCGIGVLRGRRNWRWIVCGGSCRGCRWWSGSISRRCDGWGRGWSVRWRAAVSGRTGCGGASSGVAGTGRGLAAAPSGAGRWWRASALVGCFAKMRNWGFARAAELALDCLRRFLQGLPVVERIDFEKV